MKVTFPSLGNTSFGAKALFDGLGIDYVFPVKSNRLILDEGALNSPDEICLPFKIMLGGYMDAVRRGADTVIITGSCGPCRYGEYCELQINLLRKLGCAADFIVVDQPKGIGTKEFLQRIGKIVDASPKSTEQKIHSALTALKVVKLMDNIEKKIRMLSGYEVKRGDFKKLLHKCKEEALKCNSPDEMLKLLKRYNKFIYNIDIDYNKNPLKIAIVGEIYTILEPFANLSIEDKLMDYGVCSYRGLTPSWWVKDAILSGIKLNSLGIRRASRAYLPEYIGGHGRECIGETVLAAEQGFDGAIQIYPLGCMPEIVSRSILPSISRDKDFPVMTMVVDEMTGEAGFVTRLEAFIDLIERRKENVLFGS